MCLCVVFIIYLPWIGVKKNYFVKTSELLRPLHQNRELENLVQLLDMGEASIAFHQDEVDGS